MRTAVAKISTPWVLRCFYRYHSSPSSSLYFNTYRDDRVPIPGYDAAWSMAFLGMSRALRSLATSGVVAEWWPSEGTLISLMRYGKGMEQLPGNYDVAAGGELNMEQMYGKMEFGWVWMFVGLGWVWRKSKCGWVVKLSAKWKTVFNDWKRVLWKPWWSVVKPIMNPHRNGCFIVYKCL